MTDCNFKAAKLNRVNFSETNLYNARFDYSECNNANFKNADLSNAFLTSVKSKGANFFGAIFNDSNLKGLTDFNKSEAVKIKNTMMPNGKRRLY